MMEIWIWLVELLYKNWNCFFYFILIINTLTFVMYGIDKGNAEKRKWRIPEAYLITMAVIGGGFGAIMGMEYFTHKTRHLKFRIIVPLCFVMQFCFFMMFMLTAFYLQLKV